MVESSEEGEQHFRSKEREAAMVVRRLIGMDAAFETDQALRGQEQGA
jgi:hypothetical protein